MRTIAAAAIGLMFALPAVAQENPPAAGGDTPPSDSAVLEQCRAAALAKGLDGVARHQAIAECIIAASPKIAARIHCLMDPRLKTLDKDARQAAIAACLENGKN